LLVGAIAPGGKPIGAPVKDAAVKAPAHGRDALEESAFGGASAHNKPPTGSSL
jgi:hypothetical protein